MNHQKKSQKRSFKHQYPATSYSNSLPSPPYSEENFDSSSDESNYSTDMLPKKLDKKLSKENALQENSHLSVHGSQNQNGSFAYAVYPNLMKGVTGVKSDSKKAHTTNKSNGWNSKSNRGKYRKESPKKCFSQVNCNVCDSIVNGSATSLRKHLIFGPVRCTDCNKVEINCHKFSSFEFEPKFSQQCPHHHLQWDCNPVDNFRAWVSRNMNDASEETFRNALNEYIHLLHPLREYHPWSKAIKKCDSYLNSSSKMGKLSDISQSAPKRAKKKEKEKTTEIIELPTDGHYLIVKKAIEACPNCYEILDIRDLKFKIELCLIHTICTECGLHIYFVLNPPDGSEPKVKILKDKKSVD